MSQARREAVQELFGAEYPRLSAWCTALTGTAGSPRSSRAVDMLALCDNADARGRHACSAAAPPPDG